MANRGRCRSMICLCVALCACIVGMTGCGRISPGTSHTAEAGTSGEKNLTDVTFMLNWIPDTNHIGVYVAQNKGWYADAGLNVTIVGVAQAGPEQAVNSGVADFALSNMANVGAFSLKDVHLRQVLQLQQRPSAIWCALASNRAISSPKDFDGTTFATFGASEDSAIVKRMIQYDGGTGEFDSVTVGTSTFQVLQAGKADFGGFYSTWEGVQASLAGPQMNCFKGEDYGVPGNPNEIGVVTKSSTIESNPDLVRAFVQATQRGYEYAYAHPEEAADILVKEASEANLDPALVRASMNYIIENQYWGDPEKIADGSFTLGQADIAGAQQYFDFLAEAHAYTDKNDVPTARAPQAAELATDEFLAR